MVRAASGTKETALRAMREGRKTEWNADALKKAAATLDKPATKGKKKKPKGKPKPKGY